MGIVLSQDTTNIYVNDNGNMITIPKLSVTNITHSNGYVYITYPPTQTIFAYEDVIAPTTNSIGDLVSLIQSWVNSAFTIPSSNNYFASGW